MNNSFKKEFIKLATKESIKKNTKKSLISGLAAGGVSSLALAPLSVIKDTMSAGGRGAHKSFKKTVRNLYRRGGIPRFYRGAGTGVAKLGLGMGLTFGGAEYVNQLLDKNEKKRKEMDNKIKKYIKQN